MSGTWQGRSRLDGILPVVLGVAVAAACGGARSPAPPVSAAAIEAHARFLADDLLEGRGIASRGGRLAAAYIEAVFRAAGLEAPYAGSFRQPFAMRAFAPDPQARVLCGSESWRAGEDFVLVNMGLGEGTWSGRPLFAGYAIQAPEEGWDDFKGVDVRGRLLVAFANEPGRQDPARFGGPALTVHGRWTTKLALAARLGAVGMLLVHTRDDAGYGWEVVRNGWSSPTLVLAEEGPLLPLRGWLSAAAAEQLAEAAGTSLAALRERAEREAFAPVELPVPVTIRASLAASEAKGSNVIGVLAGRTPRAVVLSAHYDHLGFGEPVDGDRIINGAVDNASAVAVLLALAQAYGAVAPAARPLTLVFAAVDAEEEGLCGSIHYTRHPVVPLPDTLANINFEMANVWGRTRDLVAIGAEHSQLSEVVGTVAARLGLRVSPDAAPEQGYFFRSDQFAFARAGVPAVWLDGGTEVVGRPAGWGAARRQEYRAHRYHRPSDEIGPDWDYAGLVQLAEVTQAVIAEIARRGTVRWRPTSPFARISDGRQ